MCLFLLNQIQNILVPYQNTSNLIIQFGSCQGNIIYTLVNETIEISTWDRQYKCLVKVSSLPLYHFKILLIYISRMKISGDQELLSEGQFVPCDCISNTGNQSVLVPSSYHNLKTILCSPSFGEKLLFSQCKSMLTGPWSF